MPRERRRIGQAAIGLALLCGVLGGSTVAMAASLALSPVRVSLTAEHPIGALTVRNDGDESTVIQLDVVDWSQSGNDEVYAPTTEILATPPIFSIPAGGSQLVRVGLRRAADPGRELSYRVFMQEVAPPSTDGTTGLQVSLRLSVPVFVAPLAKAGRQAIPDAPALQWRVQSAAGQLALHVANDGMTHVQIVAFTLAIPGEAAPISAQMPVGYVLAGQHRDWTFKHDAVLTAGTSLHIAADTDAGRVEADAVIQRP